MWGAAWGSLLRAASWQCPPRDRAPPVSTGPPCQFVPAPWPPSPQPQTPQVSRPHPHKEAPGLAVKRPPPASVSCSHLAAPRPHPPTPASQASYRVTGDTNGAFSSLVTLGSSFTLGGKATEEEMEEDGCPGGHQLRSGGSCHPLWWPRFFLSPVLQWGMSWPSGDSCFQGAMMRGRYPC